MGLVLNGFPLFDLTITRIPGVLQRISVVYLVSVLIYLLFRSILKKEVFVRFSIFFGFLRDILDGYNGGPSSSKDIYSPLDNVEIVGKI
ncbi:hypothetical protein DOT_4775 [Desulfosporosinus sp. OT]|nr:hypothetical protein DOT_4775 [Desulfosporosinus sp. OT]